MRHGPPLYNAAVNPAPAISTRAYSPSVDNLRNLLLIWLVGVPILLLTIAISLLYWKQDEVVQHFLSTFNSDFQGEIEIGGSHISPFSNFPHITIDLEDVKIWEGKDKQGKPYGIVSIAWSDPHQGFAVVTHELDGEGQGWLALRCGLRP